MDARRRRPEKLNKNLPYKFLWDTLYQAGSCCLSSPWLGEYHGASSIENSPREAGGGIEYVHGTDGDASQSLLKPYKEGVQAIREEYEAWSVSFPDRLQNIRETATLMTTSVRWLLYGTVQVLARATVGTSLYVSLRYSVSQSVS